jgi:hypothetical protein
MFAEDLKMAFFIADNILENYQKKLEELHQ